MKKRYVGKRMVAYILKAGRFPGITLGDWCRALRIPVGTAAHQRLREWTRRHGLDVRCHRYEGEYRYWCPEREAQKHKDLAA